MLGGVSVPDELFGEDYLYFYEQLLAERAAADAETIAALLSLGSGMRVLDAPCGHGRITGLLAERGCELVGLDADPLFLSRARDAWPELRFEQGDLRALPYEDEFDAVVNWFTSFGYFDRETNDAVVAGFARALRPGGRLLLEMHNPARLRELVRIGGGASASVTERGDDLIVDRVTYDEDAGFSHTDRFIVRDGHVRRVRFTLEQVPATELTERLKRAGFEEVSLFGDGGAEFGPLGRRLIAVARR
jgi:SAM-dependent methyltransferase